eukprot:jgi/Mesvir1/15776/Mv03345-RA.1
MQVTDGSPLLGPCRLGSISQPRALLGEVAFLFVLLFVAYGVAIDERQGRLYGPVVAPLLVGLTQGIIIYAGSALVVGYMGAAANPARCFGLAAATDGWGHEWVYWTGAGLAATLHSFVYNVAPPDHGVRFTKGARGYMSSMPFPENVKKRRQLGGPS